MKKFISSVFILVLLSLESNVWGQDDNKFEISFGGGLSLPVGSFVKENPTESAILDKNVSFTRIIGFAKNKNGFANSGFNYNLSIRYKISPSLRLLFLSSKFVNPIKSNVITDYLIQTYDNDQLFEESEYKILTFTPGIGYVYALDKFDFSFSMYLGYSIAKYPYYKFILLYTYPPIIFANVASSSDPHAFTFGSSISADYKITQNFEIGIDATYISANFPYHMSNAEIPGGSQVFEISDVLKVKAINVGIRLSYSF